LKPLFFLLAATGRGNAGPKLSALNRFFVEISAGKRQLTNNRDIILPPNKTAFTNLYLAAYVTETKLRHVSDGQIN
jgi:hypothetical protein